MVGWTRPRPGLWVLEIDGYRATVEDMKHGTSIWSVGRSRGGQAGGTVWSAKAGREKANQWIAKWKEKEGSC